jgi:hypothetical protein
MKIQEVAQTENYIKQNLNQKKKKNRVFFFVFGFFFGCVFLKGNFFSFVLYNFKNFYNFMNNIFPIEETLTLFGG